MLYGIMNAVEQPVRRTQGGGSEPHRICVDWQGWLMAKALTG